MTFDLKIKFINETIKTFFLKKNYKVMKKKRSKKIDSYV